LKHELDGSVKASAKASSFCAKHAQRFQLDVANLHCLNYLAGADLKIGSFIFKFLCPCQPISCAVSQSKTVTPSAGCLPGLLARQHGVHFCQEALDDCCIDVKSSVSRTSAWLATIHMKS
jgi:hypothetical protein